MSEIIIPPSSNPRPGAHGDGDVGNFYAPFFDVVFYRALTPTGRDYSDEEVQANRDEVAERPIGQGRVLLRSQGGEVNEFGVDDDLAQVRNFRSNLTIEGVSAAAFKATLTLTPPFLDALQIVENRLIKFGSLMEIEWGYLNIGGGEPRIADKGLFTITQPSIRFGSQIQIQVSGYDLFSTSARSLESRFVWDRATYKTDLDILAKLTSKILGGDDKLDTSDIAVNSKLRQDKPDNVIQTESNWIFFRRICNANDVAFRPAGAKLKIIDIQASDLQRPKYRLIWWMDPQTDRDIPMMTFETNPHMGFFAPPGTRGVRSNRTDPDTGTTIQRDDRPEETAGPGPSRSDVQEEGHPKDATQTSEGVVKAFSPPDDASESGVIVSTPAGRPNEEDEAEQEAAYIARTGNTKASATCPGVPSLLPQTNVEVVGVGKVFGGNYRVMRVQHNLGKGYTMQLELLRTASTGDPRDETPRTEGRENTQSITGEPGQSEEISPRPEEPS